MKKMNFYLLIFSCIAILSGCGNDSFASKEFRPSVKVIADELKWNEKMRDYLTSTDYEMIHSEKEDKVETYNIIGSLNDSFDQLTLEEQYDFLLQGIDIIREKLNDENPACRKNYRCEINDIVFSTWDHTYTMRFEWGGIEPLKIDNFVAYFPEEKSEIIEEDIQQSEESEQASIEESEKNRYVKRMQNHAVNMQKQFVDFSDLFGSPQFGDMDWMIDLSVAITEISRLSDQPKDIYPPSEYQETHAIYLEAMKDYKSAMDMLPIALDNMDIQGIQEANEYMEKALEKVKIVHAKLAQ